MASVSLHLSSPSAFAARDCLAAARNPMVKPETLEFLLHRQGIIVCCLPDVVVRGFRAYIDQSLSVTFASNDDGPYSMKIWVLGKKG